MSIEIRRLSPQWVDALGAFFQVLEETKHSKYFHPHPLTIREAARRCSYRGKDLYYILVEETRVLGYGMLRGWDEGYETPSLGIAVHPSECNRGLGKVFMHFLHAAARRKGARKVRLRVHCDNAGAIKLYEGLGYRFNSHEDGQKVGVLDIKIPAGRAAKKLRMHP